MPANNVRLTSSDVHTLASACCFGYWLNYASSTRTGELARANALREAVLIRDSIFALFNANHLSINELNYLIESLAIDLN